MEAVAARRKHIEARLAQDEAKIKELSDRLSQSEKLTKDMVDILDSFDGRLTKMDKTIMPVYKKTKQLTALQENIDSTMTKLQQVIDYHHVADEVDPKLREGPKGNFEAYLKLLDKLRAAVDFFRHNNPSSMELSHVTTSFDRGIEILEKNFRDLLRQNSEPVPYAVLQKMVDMELSQGGDEIKASPSKQATPTIQHLPDIVVKDLSTVARYVVTSAAENRGDILNNYGQIRSNTLGRTLSSFYDNNTPRKQAYASSFAVKPATPTKKQGGKKKDITGLARSKIVQGKLSTSSLLAGDGAVTSDEPLEGATVVVKLSIILMKLMKSEFLLMERIVPQRHHSHVFNIIISEPINYLISKGDSVLTLAQRQLSRHEFLTIISILKIIEALYKTLPEYKSLLFNASGGEELYIKFGHLLGRCEKLASKGLQDYIVYIKGDSEKVSNLPRDGTVHELTSKTMWFLEQMLTYSDTVGRLQLNHEGYYDLEDCRKAVGNFMVQTLNVLALNMEQKARNYESPVLAAVFLLNNYSFVHSTFTRKELMLDLMRMALRDIEESYETFIDNQRKGYQRGFAKLLGHLGHLSVNLPPSKNQKQALKDKFKGFNVELEELFKTQQQYSIPDPTLRRRVRDEIVTLVNLPYQAFYDEYSGVNFTKNRDKYIKYTPDDVEAKLLTFFDQGAGAQ